VYRLCLLLVHEKLDKLNSRWTAPDLTVMQASVIFVLHCFFFLEFCYVNLILMGLDKSFISFKYAARMKEKRKANTVNDRKA